MLTKLHKTYLGKTSVFSRIMVLSAWGFALAISSFLFLWIGRLIDQWLDSAPRFMLGMFFLAIVGSFIELVDEVFKILKDQQGTHL